MIRWLFLCRLSTRTCSSIMARCVSAAEGSPVTEQAEPAERAQRLWRGQLSSRLSLWRAVGRNHRCRRVLDLKAVVSKYNTFDDDNVVPFGFETTDLSLRTLDGCCTGDDEQCYRWSAEVYYQVAPSKCHLCVTPSQIACSACVQRRLEVTSAIRYCCQLKTYSTHLHKQR